MLSVVNIEKHFRGVKALKGVSAAFYNNEIHGLVGENGAGKSTLMKIICGMYPPSSGHLEIDNSVISFRNPNEAYEAGVRIVHQELSLIRSLTIAENIFIHRFKEGRLLSVVDRNSLEKKAFSLLRDWGIDIDPAQKVSRISMGVRQLVEIARELSRGGEVIILDEPTSSLTNKEIDKLFFVLRQLRSKGLVIIFISHRLNEVVDLVDRVTVLRDGEMVGSAETKDLSPEQICNLIAGGEIANLYPKETVEIGNQALMAQGFSGKGFQDVSVEVKWGEIVGLAGLVGAGRSELCRSIFGVDGKTSGEISIDGVPCKIRSAADGVKNSMALLSEDRGAEGCFNDLSVALNTVMLKLSAVIRKGLIRKNLLQSKAAEMVDRLNIVTYNPMTQVISQLSGGNQQKVLIARLLASNPRILILDEPTRGVDIANKAEIHKIMGTFVKQGGAILMVSSELDEVLGICDRLYVLHEGVLAGTFEKEEFNKEDVLKCMMGLTR